MSVTWAGVVIVAPELSTIALGTQTAILAQVALQMDAEAWGDRLDLGATYLAAHLATRTLGGGTATSGPVVSESVGQVSRSYAAPSSIQGSALGSTSYGQEFMRLSSLNLSRIGMVI